MLLFFFSTVKAQDQGLVHYRNLHGMDLSSFATEKGIGVSLGYFYFFTKNCFGNTDYTFERGKVGFTNFEVHTINIQGTYTISKPFRNFYINGYLKTAVEKEVLVQAEEGKTMESFAFHAGLGFLNEYYINSKFAVLLYADQMLLGKSKLGNQFWSAGLGVRLVLNNASNHKY